MGPGAAVFARRARLAVLDSDPGKAMPVHDAQKMPDGYKIAPHWHSGTENITIISGVQHGPGDKFDAAAMHALPAGSFTMMPKEGRHYATVKGETIVRFTARAVRCELHQPRGRSVEKK